jgi:hypothetical protein
VKGKTIIAGGIESISLTDTLLEQDVLVLHEEGKVTITAEGLTEVGTVTICRNAVLSEKNLTGSGFSNIQIAGTVIGKEIVLKGDFDEITVKAPQANVTVETGTVGNFVVDKEAAGARLTAKDGTVIESLNLYAEAQITGGKNIKHAVIASGCIKMDQKPKQVTIAEGGQTIAYSNQGNTQDQTTSRPTSKPGSTTNPTRAPALTPKPTSKPEPTTGATPTQGPTVTPTQTPGPDTIAPTVPTNLTATVVASDTIKLSWTASSDNVGVAGYRVYRKAVNEDGYTLMAEPKSAAFSDKNVTISCIYEYAVAAADTAGNESDKHFGVCIWCRPGAKTIWAASCSHSDIKTAIDTAEQGDTVLVPAGTSVWSDSITITKGIQLLGAGIDNTVIQYDGPSGIGTYAVTVSPDLENAQNDYPVRITGFTFEKLVPVYGTLLLENKHLEHPLTKVMIDHNKFINLVTASRQFSIELRHAMFGVVHNNVLQDGSCAWRFLGGLADGKEVECWAPGSLNAMYFEDNYLYTTADSSSPLAISGGNGNRYVSRYNTFDLSSKGPSAFAQTHDIHGNQPNNSGAGIGFETYGNHRIGTAGRWLDQRAGKVYFFYNRWSKSNGKGSYTVWEEYNDDAFSPHSGEGTAYPRTVAGNLIQHPYGSYYWRNFGGMEGNILSTECNILFDHYNRDYDSNPAVVNDPLILFENQNWWRDNIQPFDGTIDPVGTCGYYKGEPCTKSGIGYGTLEDMNAITPTAEGLGFWVTDQEFDLEKMTGQNPEIPIEGTLYRAVADGLGGFKWEKHYTPLVYPHPLRTLDRIDVSDP